MIYIGAILKAVFLVAVPITISVYAALLISTLAERQWERRFLQHRAEPFAPAVLPLSEESQDPPAPPLS